MKTLVCATIFALAVPTAGLAQEMKGMDMKGTDQKAGQSQPVHKAVGVVKKVDAKGGTATLSHEPVKSMNWPGMTMAFQVKDKAMLDRLEVGKKVEFEFEQRGKEHVITNVQ